MGYKSKQLNAKDMFGNIKLIVMTTTKDKRQKYFENQR